MARAGDTVRRTAGRRAAHRAAVGLVVLLAVVTLAYGVSRSGAPHGRASRTSGAAPTSPASLEPNLRIERGPFCDRIERQDAEAALGGPVTASARYGSGDRAELAVGLRDVSHEFGCTFTGASGAQARAWVFAAPVSAVQARSVVEDSVRTPGCSLVADPPAFGRPSAATLCRSTRPVARTGTLRGLFDDTWLSCSVERRGAVPADVVVGRAEQWCLRVATAIGRTGRAR